MAATIRIAILANAARARAEIDKTKDSTSKLGDITSSVSSAMAKAIPALTNVAAALGPITAGAVLAGQGLVALGQATVGLAPLASALPGLAAGAALLAYTLKGIGPALGKSLESVGAQFSKAQESAAKFATQGIAEIGTQWAKVNMPTISKAMDSIGKSTNVAFKEVGKFAVSADGIKFVEGVSRGTAEGFNFMAPAVGRAVSALGRLASRGNVGYLLRQIGIEGGRLAEKFEAWADSTSTEDIRNAFGKLTDAGRLVAEKFRALQDIFSWLFASVERFKAVSNAISLFGIALGIATGNPIAVAIGAFGLLINNWAKIKEAFNSEAFQGFIQGFKDFARPIVEQVKPALEELWGTVKRDVLPALKDFLIAIQPIVKWLAEKLGPIVGITFKYVVKIISGALKIVSGIINIFSGIITGKWSLIWKGVKQILSGAWQGIVAIVVGGVKLLAKLISAAARIIWETVKGIGKLVKSAGEGIGDALVSAGSAVVDGFVKGIKAGWGYVTDTVRYLVNQIPSAVRSMLGIASPSKVFAKIGEQTGQGLEVGLLASRAAVAKATDALISIPDAATARIDISGQAAAARPSVAQQPVVLRIESAGSALDDLLLEVLRKSIRTRGGNVQLVLGR